MKATVYSSKDGTIFNGEIEAVVPATEAFPYWSVWGAIVEGEQELHFFAMSDTNHVVLMGDAEQPPKVVSLDDKRKEKEQTEGS